MEKSLEKQVINTKVMAQDQERLVQVVVSVRCATRDVINGKKTIFQDSEAVITTLAVNVGRRLRTLDLFILIMSDYMDNESYSAGARDMLFTLLRAGRPGGFRIVTCWPSDKRLEEATALVNKVHANCDTQLEVDKLASILSEYSHYVERVDVF